MREALFAVVFCLGGAAVAAETSAALPPGLNTVWRIDGRKLDAHASAWSLAAFSTDGSLVGIGDETGTRLYRARDGALVRMIAPFSTGQFAYSLAISPSGAVALGRVGSVDFYPTLETRDPQRYYCSRSCGPVTAVKFSPDSRWLAFQAARGALEITPGLVTVVDLRSDAEPQALEASAYEVSHVSALAFAPDGGSFVYSTGAGRTYTVLARVPR